MINKFLTTPINSSSLDGISAVRTNWVVITGAPSAGKSTVLRHLAEMGHTCMPEMARKIVENGASDIRSNEASFQRKVIDEKLALEASLDPKQLVFLDRGMPDSITYYRAAGIDPKLAAKTCTLFHYMKVFLFERLPLVNDGVRKEDNLLSEKLQFWLNRDYRSLGYDPIFVERETVEERTDFLIKHLEAS